jgi:hypothetical protein
MKVSFEKICFYLLNNKIPGGEKVVYNGPIDRLMEEEEEEIIDTERRLSVCPATAGNKRNLLLQLNYCKYPTV